MHIPDSMIQGPICPVTLAVAAAGIATAAVAALRSKDHPGAARFAAVSALVFSAQMLNFPVSGGTSGHLVGGVLAAAVLGIPWGVLALALVVSLQAVLFGDGGLAALGANVTTMALVGAGLGGILHKAFRAGTIGAFAAAALSTLLAALACSVILTLGSSATLAAAAGAMLSAHLGVALGEGLLTAGFLLALAALSTKTPVRGAAAAAMLAAGCIFIAPWASALPDGLESAAARLGLGESAVGFAAALPDYTVPGLAPEVLSTWVAALIGALAVAGVGALFALAAGRSASRA